MANILMVVSAADSLIMKDGSEHPIGFWAEELVVAQQRLREAGHIVHIAGPAGLLSATDDDGGFVFAGRRLTVFSNEEELGGGTGENTPWLVEDALTEKGAVVDNAAAWTSHVVRDGNLITGQNPQSSEDVAKEVIKALG